MAPDPISAALDPIRDRIRKAEDAGMSRDLDGVIYTHGLMTGTSRRLLAALDAVLKLHQPRQLYQMVEGFGVGAKIATLCGHSPDYDGDAHFEADDGIWYCKDKPTLKVCASCADGPDGDTWAEWPCPTAQAITRALTGEGETGG